MYTINPDIIREIDWRYVERLDQGDFGRVLDIGNGIVAKVGFIFENEPRLQQFICEEYNLALPVWAYDKQAELPEWLTKEECPCHGLYAMEDCNAVYLSMARSLYGQLDLTTSCTCGKPLAVMLMPYAEPYSEHAFSSIEVEVVKSRIDGICYRLGFEKDSKYRHIMVWDDHLVGIDFGEMDSSKYNRRIKLNG